MPEDVEDVKEETVLMIRDPNKRAITYFSCGALDQRLDPKKTEFQIPKSHVAWCAQYGNLILPEDVKSDVENVPQIPVPSPEVVEVIDADEDL